MSDQQQPYFRFIGLAKACPRCGKPMNKHTATSRHDNKMPVCNFCGIVESLNAIGASDAEVAWVLLEARAAEKEQRPQDYPPGYLTTRPPDQREAATYLREVGAASLYLETSTPIASLVMSIVTPIAWFPASPVPQDTPLTCRRVHPVRVRHRTRQQAILRPGVNPNIKLAAIQQIFWWIAASLMLGFTPNPISSATNSEKEAATKLTRASCGGPL